jgi:hypothetical protein
MNLFFVNKDPVVAAFDLVDKHVVKMILECCQMMSTAARRNGYESEHIYKDAHVNHPMTKWVGDSKEHYAWCWEHAIALSSEYRVRYGKTHKSSRLLPRLTVAMANVPSNGWVDPPLCMPDEYKIGDYVESYREYYRKGKAHIHTWTRKQIPAWINA